MKPSGMEARESVDRDVACALKDRTIGEFFKALTELVQLCKPLVEAAVKQEQKRLAEQGRRSKA